MVKSYFRGRLSHVAEATVTPALSLLGLQMGSNPNALKILTIFTVVQEPGSKSGRGSGGAGDGVVVKEILMLVAVT